jgi:hypothetical protein
MVTRITTQMNRVAPDGVGSHASVIMTAESETRAQTDQSFKNSQHAPKHAPKSKQKKLPWETEVWTTCIPKYSKWPKWAKVVFFILIALIVIAAVAIPAVLLSNPNGTSAPLEGYAAQWLTTVWVKNEHPLVGPGYGFEAVRSAIVDATPPSVVADMLVGNWDQVRSGTLYVRCGAGEGYLTDTGMGLNAWSPSVRGWLLTDPGTYAVPWRWTWDSKESSATWQSAWIAPHRGTAWLHSGSEISWTPTQWQGREDVTFLGVWRPTDDTRPRVLLFAHMTGSFQQSSTTWTMQEGNINAFLSDGTIEGSLVWGVDATTATAAAQATFADVTYIAALGGDASLKRASDPLRPVYGDAAAIVPFQVGADSPW